MTTELCILGSTGSVGRNCLRVVKNLPGRFQVVALSAGKNLGVLAQQVAEFSPCIAVVGQQECVEPLRQHLLALDYHKPLDVLAGVEGQIQAVTHPEVNFVVAASAGTTGLMAAWEAIRAGKRIGLANKEVLVVAGELVIREARARGVELLPIDSEHCAVHQCLRSGVPREVRRLILTASGGPFLKTARKVFDAITPEQALRHPVWKMGGRITIDSATMMNKGLEIIEAHWLFDVPLGQIDVLIHPESIVHSMIEFVDGSVMAQLSVPDMRIPIQYALTYPDRLAANGDSLGLDWVAARRLNFRPPDTRRFPCLGLARDALAQGGVMPCAMNAADEVAVEAFVAHRLSFTGIPRVIESVMKRTPRVGSLNSMEDILESDREARRRAQELVSGAQSAGR